MLRKFRTRIIRICTRSSLAIALAFGINAVAFVWLQNKLENSIARDEAHIAFTGALIRERTSVNLLLNDYKNCKIQKQKSCEELAKAIVIRKSRLSDLMVFFKGRPFEISNDHGLVKDVESTLTSIDIIATSGFGLSFKEAKDKGINNADEYSEYIKKHRNDDLSKRITEANIDREVKQILNNVSFMSGWNSENIFESKIVEENSKNTWRSLMALIIFELVLFILVSTSDFWLTNTSSKNESSLHSRLIKTRSAIPMIGVIIFGFCAVITSQRIVYIELERTILEGCRRINRNSIFMFNQTQAPSTTASNSEVNTAFLPSYCIDIMEENTNETQRNDQEVRTMILLNSEKLSNMQAQKSALASNLALSLLIFNTFAMAFDAIKLDYQSVDTDED